MTSTDDRPRTGRRPKISPLTLALALGLQGVLIVPGASAQGEPTPGQEFLYGRVHQEDGSVHEGILRWGNQEHFWDDVYNATKVDVPWLEEYAEQTRTQLSIFGFKVNLPWHDNVGGRQFAARFVDIREIERLGNRRARLTMSDGAQVEVSGSGDVNETVSVFAAGEASEVDWDDVDRIELIPTPANVTVPAARIVGTVTTRSTQFEGAIQWDAQESIATDILDGESDGDDHEIPFGDLRVIERKSSSSALVELRDGTRLTLRGTNDVNEDIRGIFVEDERYGRVEVPWDELVRAEIGTRTLRAVVPEPLGGELRGTVYALAREHVGRIVFDLDEERGWETLDGTFDDIEYSIPFARIEKIEPLSAHRTDVTLRNGITLTLEDSQDTSDAHDGVLVFEEGRREPVYYAWSDVERIELDWARQLSGEADSRAAP